MLAKSRGIISGYFCMIKSVYCPLLCPISSPCHLVGKILAIRQIRLLYNNFLAKDVQSEDLITNITLSDTATYFLLVWHIYRAATTQTLQAVFCQWAFCEGIRYHIRDRQFWMCKIIKYLHFAEIQTCFPIKHKELENGKIRIRFYEWFITTWISPKSVKFSGFGAEPWFRRPSKLIETTIFRILGSTQSNTNSESDKSTVFWIGSALMKHNLSATKQS